MGACRITRVHNPPECATPLWDGGGPGGGGGIRDPELHTLVYLLLAVARVHKLSVVYVLLAVVYQVY